ncbi:hypothetical protein WJX73_005662 [Symbiochloris irregularis]|uniref:Uncharacterized protein n=1 Tax=Symbiochloris irregularis TaxID=706552 RepID=A0AAW1NM62_9CHLO
MQEGKFMKMFTLSCKAGKKKTKLQGELLDLVRVSKMIRKYVEDEFGPGQMPVPAQFSPEVVACFLEVVQHRQTTGQFQQSRVPKALYVPVFLFSDFLEEAFFKNLACPDVGISTGEATCIIIEAAALGQIHPWQISKMQPALCLVWLRTMQLIDGKLKVTVGNVIGIPELTGQDSKVQYTTYQFDEQTKVTLPPTLMDCEAYRPNRDFGKIALAAPIAN